MIVDVRNKRMGQILCIQVLESSTNSDLTDISKRKHSV